LKRCNGRIMDEDREEFAEEIGAKEKRKVKARQEKDRGIWFGLGMMGIIGWSVAIPTLIGVAIGVWIGSISTILGPSHGRLYFWLQVWLSAASMPGTGLIRSKKR
jgi:predicted F0F1-ATPase subunit